MVTLKPFLAGTTDLPLIMQELFHMNRIMNVFGISLRGPIAMKRHLYHYHSNFYKETI